MSTDESVDVLVIGARAAGAATAMLLARRGREVLVVDRGIYGSDTLSTHALMRGAVLQLERWGLLHLVEKSATPAIRRTAFHYADTVLDIAIKPSHGVDAFYAPRRTVLDPILVDAARGAGATVRFRTGLVDLVRDAKGRVTGAMLKGPSGTTYTVTADRVIGADGAGSTVARLAGAAFDHRARHATAVIYGYWSGLEIEGYHWHYRPGTSVGVIPTAGETCLFAAMPPTRLKGGASPGLYHEVLGECAPKLAKMFAGASLECLQFLGAGHYERAAERRGYANGTKPKLVDTLAGTLSLEVPKTSGTEDPSIPKRWSVAGVHAAPSCWRSPRCGCAASRPVMPSGSWPNSARGACHRPQSSGPRSAAPPSCS